ncbi:MAG: carboxypeptidase-like regulatory domain-containing protein [Myxococcota bacterium]
MQTLLHAALAFALVLVPAALVHADALVVVQVRAPDGTPVDGRVVLEGPEGQAPHSCTTEEGECRIQGVPGGRYTARFEPRQGEAPAPTQVVVPPAGRVVLRVAAR